MEDGRIQGVSFVSSVNYRRGRRADVSIIVLHYTAGGALEPTVKYLAETNPAQASAHFVVGRSADESKAYPGGIVQLVDLGDTAFHAGKSQWLSKPAVNEFSIGIEICNWGPLALIASDKRAVDGSKRRTFKTCYGTPYKVIDLGAFDHRGSYPEPVKIAGNYWEPYSSFQYDTVAWLCTEVMRRFPAIKTETVVGHCDVAPGRKIDPGPAWNWEKFRKVLASKI